MSCWVYTFVLSNFFFLFYIFFCFVLFSWRHSGWRYAQAWKYKRCLFLVCTVTTHSVSELLTVFVCGCSTSCGHLPWISVVLLCLSLFFFLSYFLNHSFSVVSAGSWCRSSACNHNSLIMFIDFNIKIIKPLAPHPDSCVFHWLTCDPSVQTHLFLFLLNSHSINQQQKQSHRFFHHTYKL